ncbi:ATP-binding protein [Chloroflexota bacterium]
MSTGFDPKSIIKILVLDSVEENRVAVRNALENQYLILEANSGINGIDLANDTEPNLILIDIVLPDLSSFEVATRIKTMLPNTILVALAEEQLMTVKDFGLAVGFSGYISKPFKPDHLLAEVKAYLAGKKEQVKNRDEYLIAHQSELATRVEEKVREMRNVEHRANFLIEQNSRIIESLKRKSRLLENAAQVSKVITSILDLDQLLDTSVDLICEQYDFYYAGIFLIDDSEEWAQLKAGRLEAGEAMLAAGHELAVGGNSMIGTAIKTCQAQIALDVGLEATHFKNPHLPDTRSEMALPLVVKEKVLGAITIQSAEPNAFSDDDITALQTLADQLAIAINNARLLKDLEFANQELLRNKTYEAIATATGEAIHWVGNKAAPIPGSANRIRDDLNNLIALIQTLISLPEKQRQEHPFWNVLENAIDTLQAQEVDLANLAEELAEMPANRLKILVGIESILEDLEIIEQSANTILNIKEDLIGPARQHQTETIALPELLQNVVNGMGYPKGAVDSIFAPNAPTISADRRQIERVFINLIKNAWEAMEGQPDPKIIITAQESQEEGFCMVEIIDNGPGIPEENLEKIWVSFFTTKKDKGGTGLGLSACLEIINQSGGKILVGSEIGTGTTFTVLLPVTNP